MERHADPARTLAGLRERWGAAAPRRGTEVFGALAAVPLPGEWPRPDELPARPGELPARPDGTPARTALRPLPGLGGAVAPVPGRPRPAPGSGQAIPSGFPELDALLAAGGLPRSGTVALVGTGSSGSTTLALRTLAGAQDAGALAAWIDLPRSLDPVEAVARGVRLEWLAVLVPDDLGQAMAMAGALLQSRAVDVLVLDLGTGREASVASGAGSSLRATDRSPARPAGRPSPRPADQLARLAAFARRTGALLLVLAPPGAPPSVRAALDEGAGLRLELRRRGWIRLGREVVGQRTEVRIAKDRHGAPDRRTALRILYAEGGPRDRCLARDELLAEEPVAPAATTVPAVASTAPPPVVPPTPRDLPIDRCASSTSPGPISRSGSPGRACSSRHRTVR